MPQKVTWRKLFNVFSTSWKLVANGRLFLCLHNAVSVSRGQNALQPFALAVVSVHAFRHRCLCMRTQHNLLCLVFSKKFNIMSALLANNRPPCRKKSILAKVRFDAKRGLACEWVKWIFIWRHRHLHPFWGDLPLNGVRFDAKCSAFWC